MDVLDFQLYEAKEGSRIATAAILTDLQQNLEKTELSVDRQAYVSALISQLNKALLRNTGTKKLQWSTPIYRSSI